MLKKVGYIGYLVITIPEEYRKHFLSQEILSKFRRYVIRKLKRLKFTYGKCFYHWAGEKGGVFHPHLNILLIGKKWFPKKELALLKCDIYEWLRKETGVESKEGKKGVVVDYHFYRAVGQVWHKIKYITRPTLLLIKDQNERMKVWYDVVAYFRNDVEFGRPGDVDLGNPSEDDIEKAIYELIQEYKRKCKSAKEIFACALAMGYCPRCYAKVHWQYKNWELSEDGLRQVVWWFDGGSREFEREEFFIDIKHLKWIGLGFYYIDKDILENTFLV
jgi:hypothetical protein